MIDMTYDSSRDSFQDSRWRGMYERSTEMEKDLIMYLKATSWKGSSFELLSWLPLNQESMSFDQLRDVLVQVGYQSQLHESTLDTISMCDLPTIGILKDGTSVLIQAKGFDELALSSGGKTVSLAGNTRLQWLEIQGRSKKPPQRGEWFHDRLSNYNGVLLAVLILSLANALLCLALPLFTMSVYDFLIPSGSTGGLVAVGSGAFIALAWIVISNRLRARMLSRLAADMSYQIGRNMFSKLISSPTESLLRENSTQNMSRIRSIDRVREFLGGTMTASLFDAPFVIVALVAIAWLSGWLVLVPIFGLIIYTLLTVYFNGYLQQASSRAAKSGQKLQEHTQQALNGLVELREANVHSSWLERFSLEAVRAARANFKYRMATSLQQTVAKFINMFIALATLMSGIYFVFTGVMTAGGLIAAMMLIWRVTGPLQMAFLSGSRIRQFRQTINQINAIMDAPHEQAPEKQFVPLASQKPSLTAERLVYRYASDRDAALNGVSFEVIPGQKVAIVGPNGSGKSTLLACFAGLFRPQAGSIQMDGYDIRQFKALDYRNRVILINNDIDFIEGSIRDNLLASTPLVSEEEMNQALSQFGIQTFLDKHYKGLDTVLMHNGNLEVDQVLALGIKLLRASLRDADVYLIDDLYQNSEHPVMQSLHHFICHSPADKTIIYATHDKDLMLQGDIAVIMEKGSVSQVAELNKENTDQLGGQD